MNDSTGFDNERNADFSLALGSFASNLRSEDVPGPIRQRAQMCILDGVGIALAASTFDYSRRTLAALQEIGGGSEPVIATNATLSLRDAVMMNGFLVHGLDYDDTHVPGVIHGTASAFPTALGISAHARMSGRDLLTAYIVGMEVNARLGAVAKGGFHQVGFHPTGLVGTFGCTLIAGKLYGLDINAMRMAQGIALSFASGSLEFLQDGAWTKRLHPGWAGASGITAATLAKHGFIGPGAPYDGRFGLYASYLGPLASNCDYSTITAGLGSTWELEQVAIKPFPACHFTHACVDAAIELARKHDLHPADIRHVRALVPKEVVMTVCEPVANKMRPANGYDAQFSIPFLVATGLSHRKLGLAELTDAALKDPVTLELASKVHYESDPASGFPKYYSGEVIVSTHNGQELRHREHINRGSVDRPILDDEITAKFMENAQIAVTRKHADEILNRILSLDDETDARNLAAALTSRP